MNIIIITEFILISLLYITNINQLINFLSNIKRNRSKNAECAIANNCAYIITRNTNDFSEFGVPLLTPTEAIEKFDK